MFFSALLKRQLPTQSGHWLIWEKLGLYWLTTKKWINLLGHLGSADDTKEHREIIWRRLLLDQKRWWQICTFRIYISKQGNSRSYFYGGLITTTIYSESTEDIPSGIEVKDYALLHIKCCRENDTPIVGNLSEKLSAGNIDRIKLDIADMSMGSK